MTEEKTELVLSPEIIGLKNCVKDFYSAQHLRIEMVNRVSAQARGGYLTDKMKARLDDRAKEMIRFEKSLQSDVKAALKHVDIWDHWLKDVKGVGPAMGGVIVGYTADPARFDTVSKLWAYAGLHVINTCAECGFKETDIVEVAGHGPTRILNGHILANGKKICFRCHEMSGKQVEFIGRAPRRRKGEKANWVQVFRAKLIGVLGPSFLKAIRTDKETGKQKLERYSLAYYEYRARCLDRPCGMPAKEHLKQIVKTDEDKDVKPPTLLENGCTNIHIHNKAIRYTVKLFLCDFLVEWRTLRGLPNREPYQVEYLGKKKHAAM